MEAAEVKIDFREDFDSPLKGMPELYLSAMVALFNPRLHALID